MKQNLSPSNCRLTTASGQELETFGEVDISLKIGKTTTLQTLVVADLGNCQGILGLDFLEKNSCLLNLAGGVLEIKGRSIPLVRETSDISARLEVEDNKVIPPRSETFVWTKLCQEKPIQEAEGLVEGLGEYGAEGKLLVPRCLVAVVNNRALVPITNFSNEEVQIKAGTRLAKIEGAMPLNSISLAEQIGDEQPSELPEHLEEMMTRVSPKIKDVTKQGLRKLLLKFHDVFSRPGGKLGRNGRCRHHINVQGHPPIKLPPRRYPLAQRAVVEEELKKMLANDIIEPSASPWAANVVLVKKKDNSIRFCVDYRKLNAVTKKDAYPLPHIGGTLDALSGSKWFSCLDLSAGFNQVEMDPNSKEYTAFNTHQGLYQYKVLPFGLCNSPPTFQRLMELVLSGLIFERCLVYIDDVVVLGRTEEEALENLKAVLVKFREANLKLKPSKCALFQEECTYLGHTIRADGTTCETKKVEAVQAWPEPRNVTEVRSFLGTCSYYRKYIPNFAEIAAPLTNLTRKSQKFCWSPDCQQAFDTLKKSLTTAPVLSYPNETDKFILDTDASGTAIGAVLSQIQDGEEKVLSYASAILPKAKQNYCTTFRELYAVVKFVKYFSHYLWGRPFLVRTDHGSLRWLQNFKNPEGVVARWLATLGTYDFVIEHRRGSQHGNADGLSRIPRKRCMREECQECMSIPEDSFSVAQEQKVCAIDHEHTEQVVSNSKDMESTEPDGEDHEPEATRSTIDLRQPGVSTTEPIDKQMTEIEGSTKPESPPSDHDLIRAEWLEDWKPEEMLKFQQDDPITKTVITKLQEGIKPDSDEILLYGSSIRTLFRRWDDLEIINHLLYIKVRDPVTDTHERRLVAPEAIRTVVMKMLHDERSAGHLGRTRTLNRIKNHVYWPGMAEDVALWVKQCDLCARRKAGPGRAKNPMGHKNVGIPFERIAMDIMGPLPTTHDGFMYIMVVECYFSKWVEAYCLVDHTAQSVGDKLLTQWICRYGVPSTIHTDQGPEFESHLFHHLCKELGTVKTKTTPYHPQSDGMVERQNRTIQQMLSCYVNDCQDDWSDHLDFVMMAYRSSLHESTGCTPNRIIFGKEVNLPLTVRLGEQHFCQGIECPIEYVNWVRNTLEKVYGFVRDKSKCSTAKQKAQHDKKCRVREVQKGTLVWRWYPPKGKPKLGLGWTGPYKVQELLGRHTVKLKSHDREVTVHLNDVKPYEGKESYAETDSSDDDSEVEEIPELGLENRPPEVNTSGISDEASETEEENNTVDETKSQTTRRGRQVRLPLRFRR